MACKLSSLFCGFEIALFEISLVRLEDVSALKQLNVSSEMPTSAQLVDSKDVKWIGREIFRINVRLMSTIWSKVNDVTQFNCRDIFRLLGSTFATIFQIL